MKAWGFLHPVRAKAAEAAAAGETKLTMKGQKSPEVPGEAAEHCPASPTLLSSGQLRGA